MPKLTFRGGFGMFYPLAGLLIYKDLKFGMSIGGLEFGKKRKRKKKKPPVPNLLNGLCFKKCHLSVNMVLLM